MKEPPEEFLDPGIVLDGAMSFEKGPSGFDGVGSIAMKLGDVLRRVGEHLHSEGHPWALVGGHALAAYGKARSTLDLDLLVPGEAQHRLIEFMERLGYETLHRSSGFSNHLHSDSDLGRVDFIYVRGETQREIFEGAREVAGPDGVRVSVPRAEHLIAMKVQAMKNDPKRKFQDMADIAGLLESSGVDRPQVRSFFERAGMLALWDELDDRTSPA